MLEAILCYLDLGMKRVIGGSALIGLSLFMLLGFTKAKLPTNPVVKVLTFGIAVVLPLSTGAGLIYSQFKPNQNYLNTRRKELQARTIQAEILKLAIAHNGKLTAVEVIAGLGITSDLATQHLNLLTHKNLAELEITESGTLVYAFQDVQALSEKLDSKRIADA
jgi:hypothetical protein